MHQYRDTLHGLMSGKASHRVFKAHVLVYSSVMLARALDVPLPATTHATRTPLKDD